MENWKLHQIDVSNAFLHGTLDERIIVSQPYGFHNTQFSNHVCLLRKSLYELKRSPRMWYQRLREFLQHLSFAESFIDLSLFVLRKSSATVYLFVYVDNIVVIGLDEVLVCDFIKKL